MGLHGSGGDAEGVGDLGLGEVEVVPQDEHLTLPPRQAAERGEHGRPSHLVVGRVVGAGLRLRCLLPLDVTAMAETIVRCLDDPELLRRLSAGTAQSAKKFTQEAFVARWSAIYNTLDAKGWAEQN